MVGIILSSVLIVEAGRLNDPRMNRDCYKGDLLFYVCVIAGTNIMEKSFLEYPEMHDYYTPQLKETIVTGGVTQTYSGSLILDEINKKKLEQFLSSNISMIGSVSYTYTKNGN